MTPTTLAATILRDVPTLSLEIDGALHDDPHGFYMDKRAVLAALSAALDAREAALREAELTVPDEIELYRIIKRAGAKKRIDIARAVSAHLEPMRRAFAALIGEART